ncbi:MAG: ABC transporter permease [Desulfobacterales bacterium]|nr:ABC transporter permease [Desulfobacterales bacterium]
MKHTIQHKGDIAAYPAMRDKRQPAPTSNLIVRAMAPLVFLILLIMIWEIAVRLFKIPSYLIPSPTIVSATILKNLTSLLMDSAVTLFEAVLGFMLGTLLAFFVAVLFTHSQIIEKSVSPYFVALQAVPIVATAPLLIIWFGNGLFSKVVMAAMICFFPMVVNSAAGLKSISENELDLMRLFSANPSQIFFKLRLPASLPFLFSGLKISATLSVIGAVVAELAGATKGLGFQILISSYQTDTPFLFAAVLFSALIGVLFFNSVVLLEKLLTRHGRIFHNSEK